MWKKACLLASLSTVLMLAQSPEYFPLEVGNNWVYRAATGNAVLQMAVTGTQTADNGNTYYVVTNFAGSQALLRQSGSQLLRYDATTKQETVVEDFTAATNGQPFSAPLDNCTSQGTVTNPSGPYDGPSGSYSSGVTIVQYTGTCPNSGVQEDRFLPYVGLLSRTQNTSSGPQRFDLVYSITGGVTSVTAPHVSFSLSLDQPVYTGGAPFLALITFRNTTSTPVALEWFSAQRFDLAIFNDSGTQVYLYTNGTAFPQLASNENFQGERDYVAAGQMVDNNKVNLPPGRYVAQAYLTTRSPLAKKYSASVGFEVQ